MNKDKLVELAERCEAAAESKQPGLIWEAGGLVYGPDEPTDSHSPHAWFVAYAQAEAWLDAAWRLVPEGAVIAVTNCDPNRGSKPDFSRAAAVAGNPDDTQDPSEAATPALALCAAALRSHAQPK